MTIHGVDMDVIFLEPHIVPHYFIFGNNYFEMSLLPLDNLECLKFGNFFGKYHQLILFSMANLFNCCQLQHIHVAICQKIKR